MAKFPKTWNITIWLLSTQCHVPHRERRTQQLKAKEVPVVHTQTWVTAAAPEERFLMPSLLINPTNVCWESGRVLLLWVWKMGEIFTPNRSAHTYNLGGILHQTQVHTYNSGWDLILTGDPWERRGVDVSAKKSLIVFPMIRFRRFCVRWRGLVLLNIHVKNNSRESLARHSKSPRKTIGWIHFELYRVFIFSKLDSRFSQFFAPKI